MPESLWKDLRYALRSFGKSRGFTVAAIVALALGIGANAAIFSVVYTVLFRALPYPDPDKLVMIWQTRADIDPSLFPDPKAAAALFNHWLPDNSVFERWRERNRSFERMAGFQWGVATLTGVGEPERPMGLMVTPDFFAVIGAHPKIGRTFLPEEDRPDSNNVVVLADGLWRHRFASDPGILGRKIVLDGVPHTVIGVMPAGFRPVLPGGSPQSPEFLLPSWHQAGAGRKFVLYTVLGRMKPGLSLAQAQAEMTALAMSLQQESPQRMKGRGVRLIPLTTEISGETRPAMLVLLGAVACVLLICCANVANLLLARASSRRREIGMRAVLGAGSWRLARQMLTESVLLALLGGAAGLLVARWGVQLLIAAIPPGTIPRVAEIHVDAGVLAFGLGLSVLTGLLFGLFPAFEAGRWSRRAGFAEVLKEGGGRQGTVGGGCRLRSALVVSEVAVALVLLTGAGLLIRSFVRLRGVDLGFRPENVLSAVMPAGETKYPDKVRRAEFADRVLERVRGIPAVQAAAIANSVPVAGGFVASVSGIELEGRPSADVSTYYRAVTPDFFRVMGMALRKGRSFTAAEAGGGAAIVNQAFVKRYVPNVRDDSPEPLGRHVKLNGINPLIVGVVADIKFGGANSEATPELYLPYAESFGQGMALVVRTADDPMRLAPLIRGAVRDIDPDQPLEKFATMEDLISESVAQPRFHMLLLAVFAGLALALAAVGIYAVLAYSVTQRTHEIGIRMALGAGRGAVLRMVIGQALVPVVTGVVIGLASAAAVTRVLRSFLFEVTPLDGMTFAGVSALLMVVAVAASWLPALRATHVDPMTALRGE